MKPEHSPLTLARALLHCLTAGAAADTIRIDPGYDITSAYRLAVAAECTYHINREGPCSPGDPQKARSDTLTHPPSKCCAASRPSVLFE